MATRKTTHVTFVLDETGSMESIKDDTIGGFNAYLDTLKEEKGAVKFTLLKFDSNRVDKVCVDTPIAEVPRLTNETYQPGAMTPLIDASYKAIEATAEKVKGKKNPKVIVVIQTDGYENASTEHTREDLAALVKEKTADGWVFTFLGAGIDAFGAAANYGIAASNTMSYDRHTSKQTFAAVAESNSRFMASGNVLDAAFTKSERKATGGHMPKAPSISNTVAAARRTRTKPKIVDDFTI